MRRKLVVIGFVLMAALVGAAACSILSPEPPTPTPIPPTITPTPTPTPTPIPPETTLGDYLPGNSGGFSAQWVVYMINPPEGSPDAGYTLLFNGSEMGPYSSVSDRFEISQNGEHVAVAAQKGEKWVILVDGEEKWQHDGLAWLWWSWQPDLEGQSYIPQTQAAVLEFSPSGEILAYMVSAGEERWAFAQNGVVGPAYKTIYTSFTFQGETLVYHAQTDDGEVMVLGEEELGPFESVYSPQSSPDGEHLVFYAKGKDGKHTLYVDGEARPLQGEAADYEIGNAGELAVALRVQDRMDVIFNDQPLAQGLLDVKFLTLSPDGLHLAYWGKTASGWKMYQDQAALPALFLNYYYYYSSGIQYALMWDSTSSHIAYFGTAENGFKSMLDQASYELDWEGFAITVYVDEDGNNVGENLMSGPSPDKQAYVDCLLVRAQTGCDPFSAIMLGNQLAYREKTDTNARIIFADQTIGPYPEITGIIEGPPELNHYGLVVKTAEGFQLVLDGQLLAPVYEAIYRPALAGDLGVRFLGIRAGKIYSAFQAWP